MSRKSYFKYLYSPNTPIPRKSLYRLKKRSIIQATETETGKTNDDSNNDQTVDDFENDNEFELHDEDLEDNYQNLEEENHKDLHDSIKQLLNKDDNNYSKTDLYAALLSLFFSSKLSQSAFSIVLNFIELVSDMDVPKDFNDCGNRFLKLVGEQSIAFSKKWFCKSCNVEVVLTHNKQRICNICNKR